MEDAPPRCDRCASWDRDNKEQEQLAGMADIRSCTRALMFWDASEWRDHDEEGDGDYRRTMKPEYETRRMFVQDGSDYRAALLTRADFFCADFKPEGLYEVGEQGTAKP